MSNVIALPLLGPRIYVKPKVFCVSYPKTSELRTFKKEKIGVENYE